MEPGKSSAANTRRAERLVAARIASFKDLRMTDSLRDAIDQTQWYRDHADDPDLLAALLGRMDVEAIEGTFFVRVSTTEDDRQEAAILVNAVMDAWAAQTAESNPREAEFARMMQDLQKQRADLVKRIDERKARQERLAGRVENLDIEKTQARAAELDQERAAVGNDYIAARQKLEAMAGDDPKRPAAQADVARLEQRYVELRRELDEQKRRLKRIDEAMTTDYEFSTKQLEEQLESLDRKLLDMRLLMR